MSPKEASKGGHPYFKAHELTRRVSLPQILKILFPTADVYREVAQIILEGIKRISSEKGRLQPAWVDGHELSNYINERLGSSRRSLAYRVIFRFLVPMGLIRYNSSERTYTLSRDFSRALKRIGDSYEEWVKG